MIKTIKKLWKLFAKTQGSSRTNHKSKTLRIPLVSSRLSSISDAFIFLFKRGALLDDEASLNSGASLIRFTGEPKKTISLTSKIDIFRPYLPLAFVVFVYIFSAVLIVFALNLSAIATLLFVVLIVVYTVRHVIQCFWALNVTEIGFDPDFYSIDHLNQKQPYVLLDPTIVTPFMIVLNFRKVNLQQISGAGDADLSLFSFVKVNHVRAQSLVVTACSVSAGDFRQLRIFLLSRKELD